MEQRKAKKQTVHLSAESHKKFQEVVNFLRQNNVGRLTESGAIQVLIDTFYDLFLTTGNSSYSERLLELRKRKSKSNELILSQLTIQKHLLNQLIYLSLATYHVADLGPAWEVDDLESIVGGKEDGAQLALLEKIEALIQKDKEIGQVKKHSH
ncbi:MULTISPECIES: hypothetical protein [unclassified Streptococcus]|uniref:hypothetical protein n=1 Tax=unclassified Streptococcus TaxID=2608887 RepID=UPI00211B09B9|nr:MULTISPECIES: hypothetical protein [unclassified Streptococcus]MCQ9212390.1 hypothetical protein [Streptococcus sp. B01]MCQ9213730.1 hypothetical protein [Streptococcus sp. O1]MCQ9214510.1 hypothetical protein [Streptococcus sp. O1]